MFELNRKDSDSNRPTSGQAEVSHAATASRPASAPRTGAIIGRSIQINGDVKGDEDLLIEGDVSGTIELKNHALTVGKEGKVKATIHARSIAIDGTMEGDLFASERIAIRATANVRGNLLAPRVSLEDGAHFKGAIEMDQQAVDKALGHASSSSQMKTASAKSNGDIKPAGSDAAAVSA